MDKIRTDKNIETESVLRKDAIAAIKRARARFKEGRYVTITEVKKRLGSD
ncbi:MAG TPA: hypothetical protein VJI75_06115 [Candidatus Nanoarchaeia archaeon]|nr:hypothetical protein [Candidatus Nanoarchaeia archaeon]